MADPTPSQRIAAPSGPRLLPCGANAGTPAILLQRPVIVIGARHSAHVHLSSRQVSKAHALLVNTAAGFYIRDLASRTRLYVNGRPVHEVDLHHQDRLRIGEFEFQFSWPNGKTASAQPPQAPPACLTVSGAELPLPIEQRVVLIGRRSGSDIPLLEESVSTAHAVIFVFNGQHVLRDLGSRTGTHLNGQPIHQAVLHYGDQIRIGETDLRYEPSTVERAESQSTPPDHAHVAQPEFTPGDRVLAPLPTIEPPPAIDLHADPDVSGGNETLSLPAASQETAKNPVLSEQIVEGTEPPADEPVNKPDESVEPAELAEEPVLAVQRGWKDEPPTALESVPAPVLAPASSPATAVEVIEPTEPTPESALSLDQAVATPPQAIVPEPPPSDSQFGAMVEQFSDNPLELVESDPPVPVDAEPEAVAPPELVSAAMPAPELQEPAAEDLPLAEENPTPATDAVPAAASAPAEPPSQLPPAAAPAYLWGANQASFLAVSAVEGTTTIALTANPSVAAPPMVASATFPLPAEDPDAANTEESAIAVAAATGQISQESLSASLSMAEHSGSSQIPVTPPPAARRLPHRRLPVGDPVFSEQMDDSAPFIDETVDPFGPQTPAPAASGTFDGLAMSAVREADVFSQLFPVAPTAGAQQIAIPDTGGSPRAAGEEEDFDAEPAWEQMTPDEQAAAVATRQRRSGGGEGEWLPPVAVTVADTGRLRRSFLSVPALAAMMLLCMGAAVVAIRLLVPSNSFLEASLLFKGQSALNPSQQTVLDQRLTRLLGEDKLRLEARDLLRARWPQMSPGFLNDPVEYLKLANAKTWPATRTDTLLIRRPTDDLAGDSFRLYALLLATYNRNTYLIGNAAEVHRNLEDARRTLDSLQKRYTEMKAQIDQAATLAENRPSVQQIKQMESDLARLETQRNAASALARSLREDVNRLQQGTAALADDPQLRQMQQDLERLSLRLDAARQPHAPQADKARKTLDTALEQFQQQVAAVQAQMKDNPEFRAYLTAAQTLQEGSRQLIDQLIQHQQEQQGWLSELKHHLDEQMETRRNEVWDADGQLKDLKEQLALAVRRYNAANSAGGELAKEAADLKDQIRKLMTQVDARKTALGNDRFYTDAITRLQQFIDLNQKRLDKDRADTDQKLEQLQKTFMAAQPMVDKLPAEQQALANQVEQRMAALNNARRAYARALDAQTADAAGDLQRLADEAQSLQTAIDARRRQLAQQNRNSDVQAQAKRQQKEAELAAAQQAETTAKAAYDSKYKELLAAQAAAETARTVGYQRDARRQDLLALARQVDDATDYLQGRQREAAQLIEPVKPDEQDSVKAFSEGDRRSLYTAVSIGGIAVVFALLILVAHRSALPVPALPLEEGAAPPDSAEATDDADPSITKTAGSLAVTDADLSIATDATVVADQPAPDATAIAAPEDPNPLPPADESQPA